MQENTKYQGVRAAVRQSRQQLTALGFGFSSRIAAFRKHRSAPEQAVVAQEVERPGARRASRTLAWGRVAPGSVRVGARVGARAGQRASPVSGAVTEQDGPIRGRASGRAAQGTTRIAGS